MIRDEKNRKKVKPVFQNEPLQGFFSVEEFFALPNFNKGDSEQFIYCVRLSAPMSWDWVNPADPISLDDFFFAMCSSLRGEKSEKRTLRLTFRAESDSEHLKLFLHCRFRGGGCWFRWWERWCRIVLLFIHRDFHFRFFTNFNLLTSLKL